MKTLTTILLLLFVLINLNCSSSKEIVEIKPKVIYPPVIEDTIKAVSQSDSVIIGIAEPHHSSLSGNQAPLLRHDTSIIVKYFPQYKKFYVRAKPDSIVVFDTVRTVLTVEKNIETPFLTKIGLVMIGIVIALVGIILLKK